MFPLAALGGPAVARAARPGPQEFFARFFAELERRGLPYVVLRGHDRLGGPAQGDVDYAVSGADLPRIRPVLQDVADRSGWVLTQTVRHGLFASYSVVLDPDDPARHLVLDVCSHYGKGRCLLLRDRVLLDGRRRHPEGFFVPSPASEFAYLLAKILADNRPADGYLPRLRELRALDPEGTRRQFGKLCGDTGRDPDEWLREPPEAWGPLRRALRERHRYGPLLMAREALRLAGRLVRPPGLHVAVLGPDGAGKSTLLTNLEVFLGPCFGRQRVFKFRPDVFRRIQPVTDPTPHLREPRSPLVSWLKVLYYFTDW